jgi:hypothetical protein
MGRYCMVVLAGRRFFPHGCIYLVTASEEEGSKGVFCVMKQELRFGCAVHMKQRRTVNMY